MGRGMELRRFASAAAFLEVAQAWLERREVENSLMLGLAVRFAAAAAAPVAAPYYAALVRGTDPCFAVLMTPPHRLILAGAHDDAASAAQHVAADLRCAGLLAPGVIGRKDTAVAFAAAWAKHEGGTAHTLREERIYDIKRVASVPQPQGELRTASPDDAPLVAGWLRAFHHEATPDNPPGDADRMARRGIHERRFVLWQTDKPVAMAASARPTRTSIGINAVYTPIEHRRRGYATALVAGLCRRLLVGDRRTCCLYADLANPTSNHIYRTIGFRPVCDAMEIAFAGADAPQQETGHEPA